MGLQDQEIVKKLDSDRVLESILSKIQSTSSLMAGTEFNQVLSGINDITKTALSPLKMITSGMSTFKKNLEEFERKQNEDKKDKNQEESDIPEDIAKDTQVLDLSEHLKELITVSSENKIDLSEVDNSLENSRYFLEDISKSVGMLIYGNQAIENQLKSNQKNTKVFQVSKKELTQFEKEQLKLQEHQSTKLSILDQIRNDLADLDENLTADIVDALEPSIPEDKHQSNEEDADFGEKPKVNAKESPKDKEDKEHKNKTQENLKKISSGISLVSKFMFSLVRSAQIAMITAAAQLAAIGAIIVGIDLAQAIIRTKFDEWGVTWDNWYQILPGKIGEAVQNQIKWLFENFIAYPIETVIMWLKTLGMYFNALKYEVKLGLARVVGIFSDDKEEEMRREAKQTWNKEVEQFDAYSKDYHERNKDKLMYKVFGQVTADENTFQTIDEYVGEAWDRIKEQVANDKQHNPSDIKTLANGQEISLNANRRDLKLIRDELLLSNQVKDKESAEYLEKLIELHEKRSEALTRSWDQHLEDKGAKLQYGSGYMSPEQIRKIQEENQTEKKKAFYEEQKNKFNEKYDVSSITQDNVQQKINHISQKERQESDSNNALTRAMMLQAEAMQKQNQNNTQINNQNNTTNIIQQPLQVSNPQMAFYQQTYGANRTNIGTGGIK